MGNYQSATEVQDATYAILNALDDNDKLIIDAATYYKTVLHSKNADDAAAGDIFLDTPVLYTGVPIKIIALLLMSRLSIPANAINYAIFRAKRYVGGVLIETMSELKTDTFTVSAFLPSLLQPVPNVPYILQPNDCLSISIDKVGAGQIVGAGSWLLVGKVI